MAGTRRLPSATGTIDPADPAVSNVLVLSSSLDAAPDPTPAPVRLLGADGRPLVYVALTRRDLTHLDDWLTAAGSDAPEVRLIDATPGDRAPRPDVPVTSVAAPDALTDLGVATGRALAASAPDPVCAFRSLTALRQYVDRRSAYRFLNAAVDRTAAESVLSCYAADPRALSDRDLHAFASLFDAVHDRRDQN
ncbi:MAG: hypothetical protein ABEH40_01495 [Haloferacaceae archaeon]